MQIFKNVFFRILILLFFVLILPLSVISVKVYLVLSNAYFGTLSNPRILELTSKLIIIIGLTYFIAMTVFAIGVYFILKQKLRILNKILFKSKKVAKGDFNIKLKANTNDEFGEFARVINHMRDRLQYSMVKLKNSNEREKHYKKEIENANSLKSEFISKVSKEMNKTLQPILNYSDIIIEQINNGKYDSDLNKNINAVKESADNLLSITTNLNEISRLEAGKISLNKSEFEISVFIEELLKSHQHSATKKNLLLKTIYSNSSITKINTDKEVLLNILGSILTYTIHYASSESEISICNSSSNSRIFFTIETSVPGTQIKIISQIFDNSTDNINNITMYLSNARLFGLVSAIFNTDFLEGTLITEITETGSLIFKLTLDKELITSVAE